jgi:hypothetical protein
MRNDAIVFAHEELPTAIIELLQPQNKKRRKKSTALNLPKKGEKKIF